MLRCDINLIMTFKLQSSRILIARDDNLLLFRLHTLIFAVDILKSTGSRLLLVYD